MHLRRIEGKIAVRACTSSGTLIATAAALRLSSPWQPPQRTGSHGKRETRVRGGTPAPSGGAAN